MIKLYTCGKHGKGRWTLIDEEDKDLRQHNWSVVRSQNGYEKIKRGWRVYNGAYHYEYLARVILARKLGRPIREEWDCHHLDGDSFGNNFRANLIELPKILHQMLSQDRDVNPASQYRWVSRDRNGWRMQMRLPDGKRHSKYFKTELEAAVYADKLFIQHYGHWFRDYPELDIQMWLNFSKEEVSRNLYSRMF